MRRIIFTVVTFAALWLSFAACYLCRGMARQRAIQEALRVFRSADSTAEEAAAAQKRLLSRGAEELSLLHLVQELNQEEHRNADMRLCRGLSLLLARRQEHAAADAASRLLDATFMWPHVRHVPDLVIELKKSVILEPTRRMRLDKLVKALDDLCLKREIDLTSGQRELASKGLSALLEQDELTQQQIASAQELRRLLEATPADAPLPQTYERWKVLTLAARSLKTPAGLGQDATKAIEAFEAKVLKSGPQSSFIVTGQHRKILSNTLKRLRDHESKWQQKRGFTASTLRFEPTSMEALQDYVEHVKKTGLLERWQKALLEPFERAGECRRLDLTKAQDHPPAWRADSEARGAAVEELCQALERLLKGERKLADITRQAALYRLTNWLPRNGLEGAAEDSRLNQLQDFLWGEREWLPDDLKQSPCIVREVCDKARSRLENARTFRESILGRASQANAPLTQAEAEYLAREALNWRQVAELPEMLGQVIEGEAAPLDEMTPAQRTYLALKCLHLQDRYRRGRKQVALATKVFTGKVVELAKGKFASRTQGEEVSNLRAIFAIWRQRDEEMLTGDLARLLQNPFPEIRNAIRMALRAIGRPAIAPLDDLVSRRQINQLAAVETAELSKEDHTKLLERQLRTGRSEAGRTLAAIGAAIAKDLQARNVAVEEDGDVVRIRRALHNALNDPKSGLRELEAADADLRRHLLELKLLQPDEQEPQP